MSIDSEIDAFFETLFPDVELRTYVWRFLASHIGDDNLEQQFTIWLGDGCNGKTTLDQLMRLALGSRAEWLVPPSVSKLSHRNALYYDYATDVTKRTRYVCTYPPEFNEALSSEMVLFLNINKANIHMICNEMPKFDISKPSLDRRIRVIPFVTRIQNPVSMTQTIERWAPSFLARLQHIYESEYLVAGVGKWPAVVAYSNYK